MKFDVHPPKINIEIPKYDVTMPKFDVPKIEPPELLFMKTKSRLPGYEDSVKWCIYRTGKPGHGGGHKECPGPKHRGRGHS